jgi:hypothetical protein
VLTDVALVQTFAEFYELWPEKFQNKTNGVTQRRWLAFCNPGLRALITEKLQSEEWITDLTLVQVLLPPLLIVSRTCAAVGGALVFVLTVGGLWTFVGRG